MTNSAPIRNSILIVMTSLMVASAWAKDLPRATPEEAGFSSERLERFTALMEAGVEAGHFPGATAAIARNGEVVYFDAYGYRDREAGLEMEKDSIFRIASMSKAINGVAVMILYEEGHFFLNDPIDRFIPAFKDARVLVNAPAEKGKKGGDKKDSDSKAEPETVPANRPITIRDLLRHTAGISYDGSGIWEPGDTLEQMIDKLGARPLGFHPGERFEYGLSNDVLARLVEVVSGQPYDVFLKERIFDPLDMKDTGFWVQKDQDRLVAMKEESSKDGYELKGDPYLNPPIILAGGTGLVSTAMDYLRFCQMLLNEGELDGARILGRKSVELMRVDHMKDVPGSNARKKTTGDWKFGLTFGVRGKPGDIGELGSERSYYWGGAYGTSFWIDPEENLIGVFMVNGLNRDAGYTMPYSRMLEHFTYQALVD